MAWVWKRARPHVTRFLLPRSWCYFSFIQRLGFLFSVFKWGLAVVSNPYVFSFEPRGLPPLSLSLLLAQFLDRKCEIYFVWPELHCSFLTIGVTSLQITWLCAYCLCKVRAWGEQAYLGAAVREGDKAYRARKETKRQRGDREKGKKLRYDVKTFGLEEIPFRQQ